jgi:hypothetical protein
MSQAEEEVQIRSTRLRKAATAGQAKSEKMQNDANSKKT